MTGSALAQCGIGRTTTEILDEGQSLPNGGLCRTITVDVGRFYCPEDAPRLNSTSPHWATLRSMDDEITPANLSRELGVDAKRIRDFLRGQYGLLPPHETSWHLTLEQVHAVKAHFGAG